MWGQIVKAINNNLSKPLNLQIKDDVTNVLGTRADAQNQTVNTTNTAMAYLKGLVSRPASPIRSIQRGTHNGAANFTTTIIPISTVNPSKCDVTIYYGVSGPNGAYTPFVRALTANNLQVSDSSSREPGVNSPATFSWQIVEYN
jgi:hypothetical protein